MKPNLWWLSFCDPDRPAGQQFLGVAIVPGFDVGTAAATAHALGCNPGGEVVGLEIRQHIPDNLKPQWTGRLLTKDECAAFERALLADAEVLQ